MKPPALRRLATLSAAALLLEGGCTETTGDTRAAAPASSRMPTAAEQACLRDVTRETNNADVVLLSSFAEAGTEVIVGVGPHARPLALHRVSGRQRRGHHVGLGRRCPVSRDGGCVALISPIGVHVFLEPF